MKNLRMFLFLLPASPLLASAQSLEVSGGYAHISGDGGLDGFNIGAAAWVTHRVAMAFDYDRRVGQLASRGIRTDSDRTDRYQESFARLPRRPAHLVPGCAQKHGDTPSALVALCRDTDRYVPSELEPGRPVDEYQPVGLGQRLFLDGWRRS